MENYLKLFKFKPNINKTQRKSRIKLILKISDSSQFNLDKFLFVLFNFIFYE